MGNNGRMNDSGVWNKSTLHKKIESNEMDLPQPTVLPYGETNVPYVFVGDDAFALKTFMMKPYAQRHLNISRRVYNYRHSRARRISENLFGILSNRFRVFQTVINLDPNKAKFITMSAFVLHNFLRQSQSRNVYCPPGLSDQDKEYGEVKPGAWRQDIIDTAFIPLETISHGNNPSIDVLGTLLLSISCTKAALVGNGKYANSIHFNTIL